jgi:hypothetical protein
MPRPAVEGRLSRDALFLSNPYALRWLRGPCEREKIIHVGELISRYYNMLRWLTMLENEKWGLGIKRSPAGLANLKPQKKPGSDRAFFLMTAQPN